MENINFIYGKTPDGRNVTLDGFRVESYATYANNQGLGLVDVYFKSGQEVTVLAEDEDGEFIPIPDQLDACWNADPEIVAAPHPMFSVMCRRIDNRSAFKFDPNSVAWFREQKQPWEQDQTEDLDLEELEPGSLSHLIGENGHAVIPDGATEIVECAFSGCRNLVQIAIPRSVKVINFGAFYDCTALTSVVIPEGVEEIQECVFKGCTALKDVTLPKSLKRISFDAFEGCPCEEAVMKECEARSIII